MLLKISAAKDESMIKPTQDQDYKEAQNEVAEHNNSSKLSEISLCLGIRCLQGHSETCFLFPSSFFYKSVKAGGLDLD